MTYIWFWVHWLAEHAPKSGICLFTKLVGLTVRNPREGAKIIFKILLKIIYNIQPHGKI